MRIGERGSIVVRAWVRLTTLACGVLLFAPSTTEGQTPSAPPADQWKVNFGGGLALTSGNKDTSTFNASYDVTYTPHARRTFTSDALLLRGETDGVVSSERFVLNVREEYRVDGRLFMFGQSRYLHDRFKRIQYLVAPTGGLGFTAISTDATTLTIDAGAGGVWEKNPFVDTRASGALTLSQKLTQTISASTTLTQSVSGLWKTQDLAEAIYQFGVALALGINSHVQLKIELLDSYSNKPTGSQTVKNDVSTIIAVVFRN